MKYLALYYVGVNILAFFMSKSEMGKTHGPVPVYIILNIVLSFTLIEILIIYGLVKPFI